MALWHYISGGRVELSEVHTVLRRQLVPSQHLSSVLHVLCAGLEGRLQQTFCCFLLCNFLVSRACHSAWSVRPQAPGMSACPMPPHSIFPIKGEEPSTPHLPGPTRCQVWCQAEEHTEQRWAPAPEMLPGVAVALSSLLSASQTLGEPASCAHCLLCLFV